MPNTQTNSVADLEELLLRLMALAPAGFAGAFHVDFITPRYLFQTYGEDWRTYYSFNGLVMKDPAVRWGFQNNGIAAWEDLVALDAEGVFAAAAKHGLNHWAVVATSELGLKSIGAFSRETTPFSQDEKLEIQKVFETIHALTHRGVEADPELDRMLTALSVNLTHRDQT